LEKKLHQKLSLHIILGKFCQTGFGIPELYSNAMGYSAGFVGTFLLSLSKPVSKIPSWRVGLRLLMSEPIEIFAA
jgi:hypothetical protein